MGPPLLSLVDLEGDARVRDRIRRYPGATLRRTRSQIRVCRLWSRSKLLIQTTARRRRTRTAPVLRSQRRHSTVNATLVAVLGDETPGGEMVRCPGHGRGA